MKRTDKPGLEHMRAVAAGAGLRIISTDDRVSRGRLPNHHNRPGLSLLTSSEDIERVRLSKSNGNWSGSSGL